ncbi:MAG TPA: glycosyltransferase [Candidatus Cloacimonadota bacterium]|nr:glycosyltransferase [Candidatus Cloacimonadota bacterium]
MKHLLLIAYFYPPLGGPGVQRPLKLVKYLTEFGWETDVITVKDIVFHSSDEELCHEDKAAHVYRIASLDPMSILKKTDVKQSGFSEKIYFKSPEKLKKFFRNLFPIDDKIGWLPNVIKVGKKLIKQKKYDAVMATMGPYTSGVAAYKLCTEFGLPLIIDYRDHWTLNRYIFYSSPRLFKHAQKWERKLLQKASAVSVIGELMKNELAEAFGKNLESKITVMYNGWDEADFENIEKKKTDKITLRYIGNFYGNRSPQYFVEALQKLIDDPAFTTDLQVEFVGNSFQDTLKIFEKVSSYVTIRSQVNHKKALEIMMSSDILMIFISTKDGNGVLTGKIFEYIRAQKPILAMLPPQGEAAELLKANGHRHICAMEDVGQIVQNLKNMTEQLQTGKQNRYSCNQELDRRHQTEKFVKFLESRI